MVDYVDFARVRELPEFATVDTVYFVQPNAGDPVRQFITGDDAVPVEIAAATAAQQLFDAGLIDAPTVAAMAAFLAGSDGLDATVTATAATGAPGTPVTVVNGGTPSARTLAFTIPAGATGDVTPAALDAADRAELAAEVSVEAAASVGGPPSPWPRGDHAVWAVRVTRIAGGPGVLLAELGFRAVPGGPTLTTGGTPFASAQNDRAGQAFDGTDTPYASSSEAPVTIGYQFASPVSINQVMMKATFNDSSYELAGMALDYDVMYGPNKDSLTVAWSVTNLPAWAAQEVRLSTDPFYGQISKNLVFADKGSPILYTRDPGGPFTPLPSAGGGSGGLTPFQQIMLPAIRAARVPGYMASPPTIAVGPVANNNAPATAPAGTSFVDWDGTNSHIWLGGDAIRRGPFEAVRSNSPRGNAYPNESCNDARLLMRYTGARLRMWVQGNGAPFRALADNQYINAALILAGVPGSSDNYLIDIPFGSAASRLIEIHTDGNFQLGGFFPENGYSLTAPTDISLPKMYIGGPSTIEAGITGTANTMMRRLGVDGYNCGVGARGVLNDGTADPANIGNPNNREKLRGRSIDYTARRFELGYYQGIINDDVAYFYADQSYGTIFRTIRDEVCRNIDLWGAAQDERPWYWSGYTPAAQNNLYVYALRDGMQQACSEYGYAHFLDPIIPGYLIPGGSGSTVPGDSYYTPQDRVHPAEPGARWIGNTDADKIIAHIGSGVF